jgi:hypothetical protein
MAITPTNSLLTALSGLGIDGAKPRPAPEATRPSTPPAPAAKPPTAQMTAPDPSRPLPRGSLVNIVI